MDQRNYKRFNSENQGENQMVRIRVGSTEPRIWRVLTACQWPVAAINPRIPPYSDAVLVFFSKQHSTWSFPKFQFEMDMPPLIKELSTWGQTPAQKQDELSLTTICVGLGILPVGPDLHTVPLPQPCLLAKLQRPGPQMSSSCSVDTFCFNLVATPSQAPDYCFVDWVLVFPLMASDSVPLVSWPSLSPPCWQLMAAVLSSMVSTRHLSCGQLASCCP